VAAASRHEHRADVERVTYEVHRHGRTYLHTAWRTHDRRRDGDGLYSSAVYRGGWIECVPYARSVSGIELTGDAYLWWNEAAGRYQRGNTPAAGSVLNFRANGRMRLGHVAVVTEVVNQREIVVTQANWGGLGFTRGGISSGISVVDVSADNDWTAVRVALGHSPRYGSVYPTYGFIYGHDAPATLVADAQTPAPQILSDQPPADLRTAAEREQGTPVFSQTVQFASAPSFDGASFDGAAIQTSVPDRSIR
jgi:CHAP domain